MTFHIDFNGCLTLDVAEVWPDGDAPEHPTALDVINAMKATGNKARLLGEWNLDDDLIIAVCSDDGSDRASW